MVLISLCIAVFIWEMTLDPFRIRVVIYGLGAIPAILTGNATLDPRLVFGPPPMTLFSSLFLHRDLFHLAGNLLFLWVFGRAIEASMGAWRFIAFYFLAGVIASLVQIFAYPELEVPIIGASGAISAIQGSYLILYPHARIMVWFPPFWPPMRLPALLVIGTWFGVQIVQSLLTDPTAGGTGHLIHIGGFIVGMAAIPIFKYGHVSLWHPPRTPPPHQ